MADRGSADALRYPAFKQMMEQQLAAKEAVSNMGPPKAIGEIRYLGTEAIEAECADLRAALGDTGTHFVEPFVTAPSPGIIAGAMKNEYYDTEEAYLELNAPLLANKPMAELLELDGAVRYSHYKTDATAIAPSETFSSTTLKASVFSGNASSRFVTVTVWLVTPGAKVSVPLAAVKSAPAIAVPLCVA